MIDILKKLVLDVKNSIKNGSYDDIIPVIKNKYSTTIFERFMGRNSITRY